MITEDYVSNGVAKLLDEKGFDEPCDYYYNPNDDGTRRLTLDDIWCKRGNFVKAATHQMAMKWLREVKDIDIIIMPLFQFKGGRIYCYEIHSDTEDIRTGRFKTYEEAVEAALKYVLENLI